jgi:hypothetical protein
MPSDLKLRQVFERYSDHPWIFLRPLGNWGDHLIFTGAESMADAIGLNWISCETNELHKLCVTPEHCIYLHGGGGYNRWASGRSFVNLEWSAKRQVRLVVQGPVSTEGDLEWLANRFLSTLSSVDCRELVFFAREETTLKVLHELHLEKFGATLALDHDTALALNEKDVLAIAGVQAMPAGNYDLVVLREDNEQPATKAIGMKSSGIALDPAYVARSFGHWVRMHVYAKSISTNRLHSSIIGAICGKPVTIGPGSYHKNRGVWQYSLASRGVRWVECIESPDALLWNLLPVRVQNSYKVRQLRLAFHRVPIR